MRLHLNLVQNNTLSCILVNVHVGQSSGKQKITQSLFASNDIIFSSPTVVVGMVFIVCNLFKDVAYRFNNWSPCAAYSRAWTTWHTHSIWENTTSKKEVECVILNSGEQFSDMYVANKKKRNINRNDFDASH